MYRKLIILCFVSYVLSEAALEVKNSYISGGLYDFISEV